MMTKHHFNNISFSSFQTSDKSAFIMRRCEPAWLNIACIAPSYQVRKHISKSMYFDIDILALKEMNENQRTKPNLMHNLLHFHENFMHYIKIRRFIQTKCFCLPINVCIRNPISDWSTFPKIYGTNCVTWSFPVTCQAR